MIFCAINVYLFCKSGFFAGRGMETADRGVGSNNASNTSHMLEITRPGGTAAVPPRHSCKHTDHQLF